MEKKSYPLGSVFEFKTSKGYAYIQLTHVDEENGPLLRVLSEVHNEPTRDPSYFENAEHRYFVFYNYLSALEKQLIMFVDVFEIPLFAASFPPMRSPGNVMVNGKVRSWYIHESETTFHPNEWKENRLLQRHVSSLTEEEKKLSIAVWIYHSILVRRIETDWLPEYDV